MWFIIGVLVGLTTAAILRLALPIVHDATIGRMSDQWLEEHQASRAA